jgi:hypothetical protein
MNDLTGMQKMVIVVVLIAVFYFAVTSNLFGLGDATAGASRAATGDAEGYCAHPLDALSHHSPVDYIAKRNFHQGTYGVRPGTYGEPHPYHAYEAQHGSEATAAAHHHWSQSFDDLHTKLEAAHYDAMGLVPGAAPSPFTKPAGSSWDPNDDYSADAGYSQVAGAYDHQTATADLIMNPRLRANHQGWVSETLPFTQARLRLPDRGDDEFVAMSQHRVGLGAFYRPAPAQHNPFFVTELDPETHAEQGTIRRTNF